MWILKASNAELKKKFVDNTTFDSVFEKYKDRYNLSFRLLKSIAFVESGFDEGAHNGLAYGLMQMTPIAMQEIGRFYDKLSMNLLLKADYNVDSASLFIKKIYTYQGVNTWRDMIICYNAGYGVFRSGKIPDETKNYILAVERLLTFYDQK